MDSLEFFAGQALTVLLTSHLNRTMPLERRAGDSSLDIERAAWRIAQNMVATRPEAA